MKSARILVYCLASSLFICTCGKNKPLEPQQTGNIVGRILSAQTQTGIPRARVSIDNITSSSGNDGFFELEDILVGSKVLKVTKTNFEEYKEPVEISEGTITKDVFLVSIVDSIVLSQPQEYDIEPHLIQIEWSEYSQDNFVSYKVYYALEPDVTLEDSLFSTIENKRITRETMRPLLKGTNYYIKVFAFNEDERYSESNEISVTTSNPECWSYGRSIPGYDSPYRTNIIDKMIIDLAGNKWIAYGEYNVFPHTSGIIRFDNLYWTQYTTQNSQIPSNAVYSLEVDNENNLWIGTNRGLCKFDGFAWTTFSQGNSDLPNNSVRDIALNNRGIIWLNTPEGIVRFKEDSNIWTTYTTNNSGLPESPVLSLICDSMDNLWIGTKYDGLVKFDGVNWTIFNKNNSGIEDDYIAAMEFDSYGNLWITHSFYGFVGGWVSKFDGKNWIQYHERIFSFKTDNSGGVWAASAYGGLLYFNGTEWIGVTCPDDDDINGVSVDVDINGDIYFGTNYGVYLYTDNPSK